MMQEIAEAGILVPRRGRRKKPSAAISSSPAASPVIIGGGRADKDGIEHIGLALMLGDAWVSEEDRNERGGGDDPAGADLDGLVAARIGTEKKRGSQGRNKNKCRLRNLPVHPFLPEALDGLRPISQSLIEYQSATGEKHLRPCLVALMVASSEPNFGTPREGGNMSGRVHTPVGSQNLSATSAMVAS